MAKEWAVGDEHDGFANRYRIALSGLKVLNLAQAPFNTLHWLSVLVRHRVFDMDGGVIASAAEYLQRHFPVDCSSADVIIGYRADDNYFSFARGFLNGTLSYAQLSRAIRLGGLGLQIVLKSPEAFARIQPDGYEDAMGVLGAAVEAAVMLFEVPLARFWPLFLASPLARRFAIGDPFVLAGLSGWELAERVLSEAGVSFPRRVLDGLRARTPEYWAGWALAQYQWYRGFTFPEIESFAPMVSVVRLYSPYHEMPILSFHDELDRRYRVAHPETRLKELRKAAGLTRDQLGGARPGAVPPHRAVRAACARHQCRPRGRRPVLGNGARLHPRRSHRASPGASLNFKDP